MPIVIEPDDLETPIPGEGRGVAADEVPDAD